MSVDEQDNAEDIAKQVDEAVEQFRRFKTIFGAVVVDGIEDLGHGGPLGVGDGRLILLFGGGDWRAARALFAILGRPTRASLDFRHLGAVGR